MMNETEIKLIANEDVELYDMFGYEHKVKTGDVLVGNEIELKGLLLVVISFGDLVGHYRMKDVVKYFTIEHTKGGNSND